MLASVCDAWGGPNLTVSVPDKKAEIDVLAAEYVSTVKTLSPEQRVAHLQRIQGAYTRCKEYSDDKVQLAMQTYEMVSSMEAQAAQARAERCFQRKLKSGGPSPGPLPCLVSYACWLVYLAGETVRFDPLYLCFNPFGQL